MRLAQPAEVIAFWFDALSPKDWYGAPPRVDAEIKAGFAETYGALKDAVPEDRRMSAQGLRAAILVLDQFPRNMFRGRLQAFATDQQALALAKEAIARRLDLALPPKQRAFLYMPFQHCEDLADQTRSVELFEALGNPGSLDFASRHRDIVARFGRFPHRNAILGRTSTDEEIAFLKEPGSPF